LNWNSGDSLCRIASKGPTPGKNPNRSDLSVAPKVSRAGLLTNWSRATASVSDRRAPPLSVSDGVSDVEPTSRCW
jgi:hypothetical protein